MKLVSGGQTGVDRAALDVALKHGIDCGGWCPAGRLDELGKIPDRYPVKALENAGFAERTLANVKDSDGTIVIHPGNLSGGSELTVTGCNQFQRPYAAIDAAANSPEDAAKLITDFVRTHGIDILNLAGPRETEWPEGYAYAFRALEIFVTSIDRARERNHS